MQLAPYVSKQQEVGVKVDTGKVAGCLAFFSTSRPRAALDADNIFRRLGEDQRRGVELTVFGQATPLLRLIGGVMMLDPRRHGTGSPKTEGKRVIGVPEAQGSIVVDCALPLVAGSSADVYLVTTGQVHADAANTLTVQGWTRLDASARLKGSVDGRPLTVRARIDNLTGRRYWSSSGGFPGSGYLVLGSPRTFTATATVEF